MTKRVFFSFLLCLVAFLPVTAANDFYEGEPVYASRWRDYKRDSYFGLRFGLNIPTVRYRGTGGKAQTETLPRFHVGLVYGNKLGDGLPFFLETGLAYTEKGTEIAETTDTGLRKTILRYMEIPVVLKYKINTNVDDFTVQPFFGGYMAFGVGGQVKDYTDRTKYSPFGKSLYKRFDAGLKIGCGIAFQNFYFSMGYDIGLFDIAGKHYAEYQFDNFDGRIRTGNFTMTLGVDF